MSVYRNITARSQITDILKMYGDLSSTFYLCYASSGSPTSSQVWAIKRVVIDGGGLVSTTWADGTPFYDKVADNYNLYSYA